MLTHIEEHIQNHIHALKEGQLVILFQVVVYAFTMYFHLFEGTNLWFKEKEGTYKLSGIQ